MVYLPINDFSNVSCFYIDNYTIRCTNDNINYNDYILNNHYYKISGVFPSNFDINNQTLIDNNLYTNNFIYRIDLPYVLLTIFFLFLLCIFLPYYIFSSFFHRRKL